MNGRNDEPLKSVLQAVPPGFLVDARWFSARNIRRSSVHDYAKRGWLEHVAHGVYRRPLEPGIEAGSIADWQVLALSLQRIMGYPVHVGGTTALSLQGHVHYLRFGDIEPVFLYGGHLPGWIHKVPTQAKITLRTIRLFKDTALGLSGLQSEQGDLRSTLSPWWRWPLVHSTPERAILEALDELPDNQSFHILDVAFQGLSTLSPRKLTSLLASCKSVKVKRLFFVFADRHNHAWRKRLNPNDTGLGTGDRSLVKGGKLHPKYRITVPAEYMPTKREDAHGA